MSVRSLQLVVFALPNLGPSYPKTEYSVLEGEFIVPTALLHGGAAHSEATLQLYYSQTDAGWYNLKWTSSCQPCLIRCLLNVLVTDFLICFGET